MLRKCAYVLSLVVLGILTTLATRAVIGAQKANTHTITVVSKPKLKITTAKAVEGGIYVAAKAEVGHKLQDQELVWIAKVFEQIPQQADGVATKQIREHRYLDQVFVVGKGKILTPTFAEKIPTGSGSFIVQVEVEEIRRSEVDPTEVSFHCIAAENEPVAVK